MSASCWDMDQPWGKDGRNFSGFEGDDLDGRVFSGVIALLLLMDAAMKIMKAGAAVEGTVTLGYPEGVIVGIGVALLISTVLYMVPATSMLGAILITGYRGGAVAANLRVGNPWLSYTLFPVYVGIAVWGALFLRDAQVQALIPVRKP
jgi:hypothetical protein